MEVVLKLCSIILTKYFKYKIRFVGIDHYNISSSGLKSSDDDTVSIIL